MRILVIGDEEWVGAIKLKERNFDLIISCGDVATETLQKFIREMGKPLFAVNGNHDYNSVPKEAVNLHVLVKEFQGIRFGGFEGSWRYKPTGLHLYYDDEVTMGMKGFPKVDVFVAHNPMAGVHDSDDGIHNGFTSFREYVKEKKPRLFLHGHTHKNRETMVDSTKVISVYGSRVVEL